MDVERHRVLAVGIVDPTFGDHARCSHKGIVSFFQNLGLHVRQLQRRVDGDEVGELEICVIARMAYLAQDVVADDGAHRMGNKHDPPALMWNERLP